MRHTRKRIERPVREVPAQPSMRALAPAPSVPARPAARVPEIKALTHDAVARAAGPETETTGMYRRFLSLARQYRHDAALSTVPDPSDS
ncbi:hypothetical protein DIE06_14585 [Burkholderia sp. Bp8998]|nr:hypothetical protein DIE06_14585 [Burkholderia sp. Bp8998]